MGNHLNKIFLLRGAAHKCNNFKGSIYMVFDYMDHDMTGLMERLGYKFTVPQVCDHMHSGSLAIPPRGCHHWCQEF